VGVLPNYRPDTIDPNRPRFVCVRRSCMIPDDNKPVVTCWRQSVTVEPIAGGAEACPPKLVPKSVGAQEECMRRTTKLGAPDNNTVVYHDHLFGIELQRIREIVDRPDQPKIRVEMI